jgi:uncharacterized membrane protein YccC
MPTLLSLSLRRLWTLDKFAYSLRVFLAFSGALLLSWALADITLVIPLFLGVIASALPRPTTTGRDTCALCW